MAQRGGSGFVLGGTNHGSMVSPGSRVHGEVANLHRRTTSRAAMEAMISYEDPTTALVELEEYRLHRLGFGQDWVLVWLPSFVKEHDAMFYIVDLARGDEWAVNGRPK